MRSSGVSAILSNHGRDFIGRGVVAIVVSVVSIDSGGTSAVRSSGGGELLVMYKGFLVRGAAL